MAPREVYRCAKLWNRAGAEVRNFGVWPLGPQPAERFFFGHNKGVACGAREHVTNPADILSRYGLYAYIVVADIVLAYVVMAYVVMAYVVMADIVVAYVDMACTGMAYIVMASFGMAYVVVADIFVAYVVMAYVLMACIVMAYAAKADPVPDDGIVTA